MSSVLQVQMLHDEGADPALRAQFAFMDSPPEEPENPWGPGQGQGEEEGGAMMMDVGGALRFRVCVCKAQAITLLYFQQHGQQPPT